jgi:hypothetical protein
MLLLALLCQFVAVQKALKWGMTTERLALGARAMKSAAPDSIRPSDFFGETAPQKTPDIGLTSIRVAKLGKRGVTPP